MKRYLPLAALLVLTLASISFAQEATASPSPAPKPKPRLSKAQLLRKLSADDTKLWDAWKNKDVKPFKAHLSADSVVIGDAGVMSKADILKAILAAPCDIKSFSLSEWKLTMISPSTALLTYKGTQDGTCGGQALPATVWAASVWVNRGGRWLAVSHQETAARQ